MSEQRYGVYRARVTAADPARPGTIGVAVESLRLKASAQLATGSAVSPGDEVLIAFEAGDARQPYVVGVLWQGDDPPPDRA